MERVKMASSSSDDRGQQHPMKTRSSMSGDSGQMGDNGQETNINRDTFLDLRAQILQLLSTKLSPCSIKVIQYKLEIMHKSSFYLEMYRRDVPPSADQQQQPQQTLYMSNNTVFALIDSRRLQSIQKLATNQVKVQLTLLDELYAQIVKGCEELEAIINQYDPGLVDGNSQQALQEKVQRVLQTLNEFDSMLKASQLYLKHQLIPYSGNTTLPQISLSLAIKMPVMFDRHKSHATLNSVELHWVIDGQELQQGDQQFEIHFKILHPTTSDQCLIGPVICSYYSMQINNLIPDRSYQFSVKRVDACNLVYGLWTETMILQTKAISMQQR